MYSKVEQQNIYLNRVPVEKGKRGKCKKVGILREVIEHPVSEVSHIKYRSVKTACISLYDALLLRSCNLRLCYD